MVQPWPATGNRVTSETKELCALQIRESDLVAASCGTCLCHSDGTPGMSGRGSSACFGVHQPTIRCKSSTEPNSTTILPLRLPRLTVTRVSYVPGEPFGDVFTSPGI